MKILTKVIAGCFVLLVGIAVLVQTTTESTFFTSYLPRLLFNNNLAPVVEGVIYRSAQMDREQLVQTLNEKKIRTVIDLRAGKDDPDSEGFTEETSTAQAGVKYLHLPMFASRVPSQEKMLKLLDAMKEAERPILVHCSSGTHRSGVAAAAWLMEQEGRTPEEAKAQLSSAFGYYPLERKLKAWKQGFPTLDSIIFRYVEASKKETISFREWVKRELPKEEALPENQSAKLNS